jgi:hypothetical protein
MKRRFSFMGLIASSVCFVVFAGVWYALNHFRGESYNSAMEGPSASSSPYWTIIRVQHFLAWAIICSFGLAALMLLFEFVHFIAPIISRRISSRHNHIPPYHS